LAQQTHTHVIDWLKQGQFFKISNMTITYAKIKHVRHFVKVAMGVAGNRCSSREVEALVMRISTKLRCAMTGPEQIAAEAGDMPFWLTPELTKHLIANPLRPIDDLKNLEGIVAPVVAPVVAPATPPPGVAPVVDPETPAPGVAPVADETPNKISNIAARSFDCFLAAVRTRHHPKALELKDNTAKYKKWSMNSILRKLGAAEWKTLPKAERYSYRETAQARAGAKRAADGRDVDGKFLKSAPLHIFK
jgi:hypothetical protein